MEAEKGKSGRRPAKPLRLCYEDLQRYTDNFSSENYLGKFQFGKIYRGQVPAGAESETLPKPVTVKIWHTSYTEYEYYNADNLQRVMDEVLLLQCEDLSHPGLMKLYGYYIDTDSQECGAVYDFKPYDTLCNILHDTDNFNWFRRIKVALGLAHLLTFLHESDHWGKPFMIRNIDAAHVLVDEDWNPKLIDFSMINGGIFPDRTLYRAQHIQGCYGFKEPLSGWSQRSDVFAFGVVVVCLMTNEYWSEEDRQNDRPSVLTRLYNVYGDDCFDPGAKKISFVVQSLKDDALYFASDGLKITELASQCTEYVPSYRGTMRNALTCLLELEVVRQNLHSFPLPPEPKGLKTRKKSQRRKGFPDSWKIQVSVDDDLNKLN